MLEVFPMSNLTLITGGARSGKSQFAELLAAHPGLPVVYIATAQVYDDEMALRVKNHREQRPAAWSLVEEPIEISSILERYRREKIVLLVDCVTLWLTNLLLAEYHQQFNEDPRVHEENEQKILDQVHYVAQLAQEITPTVIMVTNEVGQGIVPDNPLSRAYRDLAGRANQILGRTASKVYSVVAGYPIEIKESGQALLDSLIREVDY
jgi:adenosylcobinamide kinase / adenosylcobinamide-phosphate guanylyltransferase